MRKNEGWGSKKYSYKINIRDYFFSRYKSNIIEILFVYNISYFNMSEQKH